MALLPDLGHAGRRANEEVHHIAVRLGDVFHDEVTVVTPSPACIGGGRACSRRRRTFALALRGASAVTSEISCSTD